MHAVKMHGVRRAFRESWLPWLSALVLVAGLVLALTRAFDVWGGSAATANAPRQVKAAQPPSAQRTTSSRAERAVPLEKAARAVARKFVLTAVARRHVAASYDLVGAALRQGFSRAEWAKGEIPVVPDPVDEDGLSPLAVDFSYENHALLEVTLNPGAGRKIKPAQFFLELRAFGKGKARRWLVVGWAPHAAPLIPVAGN
jgi:hypothetical protein